MSPIINEHLNWGQKNLAITSLKVVTELADKGFRWQLKSESLSR